MIEDINKKLQRMNIGSYSLVVDRKNKKIIVHPTNGFADFEFMDFKVVCKNSNILYLD